MSIIVSAIVNDVIQEHYRYLSECEVNSTEVAKHTALLKAKSKELQAHTEMAEKYFTHQMQERERLFKSASVVLEKAMELGDIEIAQIAVRTIEVIHKKSPFSF